MQRSMLAKRLWLPFFLAIVASYFYGLGRPPLVGPDEPRYAQVAREMFMRGDFITPTLGGHTWFEKPSLFYWMMIASYSLFGVSEFAARFSAACLGLLTVLIIYWLGRRVERASEGKEKPRGLGAWSSLALASTAGLIIFSRGVNFDIIITMSVTLTLACFYVSEVELDTRQRTWLLAGFYAGVGASLLAKGLVGIVIPFGVVAGYFLLRRTWPDRRLFSSLLWGVPLSLAVASLWYGPVIARHGWLFVDDFFIQHHFARYFSNKYHHPQPFWFYVPIIALLAFPWTVFLITSCCERDRWLTRAVDPLSKFHTFALAWVVVPIAFFSLSGSKLPGYVLPALPGAALLAGDYLVRFLSGRKNTTTMRLTGGLLLLVVSAGAIFAVREHVLSYSDLIIVAVPWTVTGIYLLAWSHQRRLAASLLIFAMLATTVLAVNYVADYVGERDSIRGLINLAAARGYGSAPVYGLHTTDHTTEFYAAGRVERAPDGKLSRFEGPQQVAEAARQKGGPVLVVVPVEFASQLTEHSRLETEIIGDNGSIALVAARPR